MLFSTWLRLNNQKGYLLVELQISMLIITILLGALFVSLRQVLGSWKNMLIDAQLYDAGRYMQVFLEKEIGYQGQRISIDYLEPLGTRRIVVQTIRHNTYYNYFWKRAKKGLYRETSTIDSSGTNPLFIPGCDVIDWDVEKVADDSMVINFTLEKEGRKKKFTQLIVCANGEVDLTVKRSW